MAFYDIGMTPILGAVAGCGHRIRYVRLCGGRVEPCLMPALWDGMSVHVAVVPTLVR
jgi:hypothetical protein